jgi:hypothetical protein
MIKKVLELWMMIISSMILELTQLTVMTMIMTATLLDIMHRCSYLIFHMPLVILLLPAFWTNYRKSEISKVSLVGGN